MKEIPTKSKIKKAVYAKDTSDLLLKLSSELKAFSKDKIVVLAMSNGAFGGIYPELIEMVKKLKITTDEHR